VADFYEAALDAQLPEATRLAETSRPGGQPSWLRSPRTPPTPSTEGFNRVIKQTKRVGCGYRNMINYQHRILSHITVTRPQISAA